MASRYAVRTATLISPRVLHHTESHQPVNNAGQKMTGRPHKVIRPAGRDLPVGLGFQSESGHFPAGAAAGRPSRGLLRSGQLNPGMTFSASARPGLRHHPIHPACCVDKEAGRVPDQEFGRQCLQGRQNSPAPHSRLVTSFWIRRSCRDGQFSAAPESALRCRSRRRCAARSRPDPPIA